MFIFINSGRYFLKTFKVRFIVQAILVKVRTICISHLRLWISFLKVFYINELMKFRTPVLRCGRDELLLELPTSNTKTIHHQMWVCWNSLPLHIRKANTLSLFKKELKTFYYKAAFLTDNQEMSNDYLDDYLNDIWF